ncbi:MAG TPA: Uma2 family endonuclease [Candidatus Rifleibacterium sp.]|nr:Uma2 family endonuclease [Candidatus Rifleibacterium sp.]HPT48334.1 Uma2 family endonuclease [Candidatus Rifleibacterium sp.]
MAGLPKPEYYTYGDYCGWRDDQRREIIEGVPYNMTGPSRQHAEISRELAFQFVSFFRGRPCQVYSAPFDVRLPRGNEADDEIDTVIQPDLLVVCDEQKLDDRGCRGAPDLIIEILSPSTASRDCIQKRSLYERHGVREFWVVDPANRIVTVYLPGADKKFGKPEIYGDTDKINVAIVEGLEIKLDEVFPPEPAALRVVKEPPASFD